MRKLELAPERIIIPGELGIHSLPILRLYHRVYKEGQGEILPPAIVVRGRVSTKAERDKLILEDAKGDYNYFKSLRSHHFPFPDLTGDETIEVIKERLTSPEGEQINFNIRFNLGEREEKYDLLGKVAKDAPYYLIDGNHKTAGATLAGKLTHAIHLESDGDIRRLREMKGRGDVFEFNRKEEKLEDLKRGFEKYLFSHIKNCMTVRERVNRLVAEGDIKGYLAEGYKPA